MHMQFRREGPLQSLHGGDVCAIVVTHHPDAAFPARLGSVSPQVGRTVIVDNGSAQAERDMLSDAAAQPNVDLLFNQENLGLARALNIGIERAAALEYSWVLLLDQDSTIDRDMVSQLLRLQASFPEPERLAVIGSNYRDADGRTYAATDRAPLGEQWDEVELVITSGSLLPLTQFFAIGQFREEFFIDFIDAEYCRRARAKGFRVIRSRQPLMAHAIGAPARHKMLWMRKWMTNHSPDRRYYIARNDTVLLRESGDFRGGRWVLKSFARCFRRCRHIALYERMKTRKMCAVWHGWWDGLRANMGPRQRPCQRGLRFSVKARVPSLRSSDRITR